ncbi:hypothetical protein COO60DRAFT_581040 [Scenedesmus sp. NREL 46B-D3]|nr:hypothetical protein COO60DRAFT_581040 [Scenedesmus sp. NREL 46B-D3]
MSFSDALLVSKALDAGREGAIDITYLGVGLAAALIMLQILVSIRLCLGLHSQLAVAAVRCVVQLSLLGYILAPIFKLNSPWLVLAYAGFMVWVSALEAIGRPAHVYKGLFFHTLGIVLLAAGCTMGYGLTLVIGVAPWWSPQYLIPVLGMVLGNTISGISVGLAAVMEELTTGADHIERLLSLGASRAEATRDLLGRAVRLAMTPLLNQMSVVGLVSIPGMMTGQILGGSHPDQAARYQMVIMFLLGAASTAAAIGSTSAAVAHVVDGCHRLRPERLLLRSRSAGVNGLLTEGAKQLWGLLLALVNSLVPCLRKCCCWCRLRRGAVGSQHAERASGKAAAGAGDGCNSNSSSSNSSSSRAVDEVKEPLLPASR